MRKLTTVFLALALALVWLLPGWAESDAAATLKEANEAYDRQDYQKAFALYNSLVDQDDPFVLTRLADMYYLGWGVEQDIEQILKLNILACALGDPYAMNNLGVMYTDGVGVEKDDKVAFKLFQLSADQGDPFGQFDLGMMYYEGCGVEQDNKMAEKYFQLSADQGDELAASYLETLRQEMSADGNHQPWNCPDCKRTNNTGNYCIDCGHAAPWIEAPQQEITHEQEKAPQQEKRPAQDKQQPPERENRR